MVQVERKAQDRVEWRRMWRGPRPPNHENTVIDDDANEVNTNQADQNVRERERSGSEQAK